MCSNSRLAYCGSLKSPGQSGKPSTFDRASFQIVLAVRLIRARLSSFVVRARRRRSEGWRCPKVYRALEWFASPFNTSEFRHTSNNISSGISIKLFRAARLPRVFLGDELSTVTSTSMLCESSRLRFEGLLSSCASGIDIAIFDGWVVSSLHAIIR